MCAAVAVRLRGLTGAGLGGRQLASGRLQQLQLLRRAAPLHQRQLPGRLRLELLVQLGAVQRFLWAGTEDQIQVMKTHAQKYS